MQASGVYGSSTPHPLYPNPYHPILAGPQDHDLKKQYLALLPPQQIIDLCLNFDLHVPPYVKSSIWPADINAAIAEMRKTSSPAADHPAASAPSTTSSHGPTPAMGSLTGSSDLVSTVDKSIDQPSEAQPPDKPSPTPDSSAQTSVQPSPAPPEQPTPTAVPPHQPPYPHQPYGYGHPQAAYPHAPYYQPPPGYPQYPSPYAYPQMPSTYPPHPPHPGYAQQLNPAFTTAPLTHPPQQQQDAFNPTSNPSTEDLPSYEEMIVEALLDSADPEGCAPKDLFTWMAARYPLQSNFRPSASQALQKAFKRGRFQKSDSGKYRLNATWEGGNTSRRTTRRPQTQNPPAPAPAPASPFTHAPLVHHHQPTALAQNHGYQPQGYSYSFQQQSYPGYTQVRQPQAQQPQQPQPQPGQPATTSTAAAAATTTDNTARPLATAGAAHDAWEAAQNILKAINFDSLLQLPKEDEISADRDKVRPSTNASASLPITAAAGMDFLSGAAAVVGAPDGNAGRTMAEIAAGRAELQAHLALLAAQLAELSQEDDDDPVVHYPVVGSTQPPAAPAVVPSAVAGGPPSMVPMGSLSPNEGAPSHGPAASTSKTPPPALPLPIVAEPEEEEDSENDDDMEEVI
ncbi:hypothetical protein D9615_001916 [Tricholomella constricta]|uniref:Histone H1 n=1 Tax=Tricholomella constricta TaxID=117010 RepID=A0A8H5HNM7_9AGAR|nr:hypothetical protein D9615_001916 [Tricholomella constricta]